MTALSKATQDVLAERERQRQKWGDLHDDEHTNDSLAYGAVSYMLPGQAAVPTEWAYKSKVVDRDPRRDQLVKGAALALAAVEQFDRAAGVPGTFNDQQEQAVHERKCVITIWNRQFDVVPYYRERGFKVLPPDLTMQGHDIKRLGGVPGDRTLTRQRDQKVIGEMETVIVQPGDDFDATPPATGSFR